MDSESDFYGDEEEVQALESRVAAFDPSTFWHDHEARMMASPLNIKAESAASNPLAPATLLHNPYEGRASCAKQLSETTETFLSRLPPATTDVDSEISWIYVANPFIPRQDRGGEEAPAEYGAELDKFKAGGEKRLEICGDFVRGLEARTAAGSTSQGRDKVGPSKAMVAREIAKEKAECVDDILMLAKVLKVRTGKWMLFIEPALVNDVWATVVRATVQNELGIAAKVAPREERGSKKERLVCIYTYDFTDKDDIGRVLARMKKLDLVRTGPGRRPIYYKTDAYTYLGIAGGNPWGLKASIYSSTDIFAHMRENGGMAPLTKAPKQEDESKSPVNQIKFKKELESSPPMKSIKMEQDEGDSWTF